MVKELESSSTKVWMLNPVPTNYREPQACYGLSVDKLIQLANEAALQVYNER